MGQNKGAHWIVIFLKNSFHDEGVSSYSASAKKLSISDDSQL